MNRSIIAIFAASSVLVLAAPAFAQDNLGHFYMARQQIQILDNAPVIYDKRTQPGAATSAAGLPVGPAPLPRASFTGYSSTVPSMSAGLPEVVNGVPRKIPSPRPAANVNPRMGKAGAYKPKAAVRPAGSSSAKTYAPYKGYGGGNGPQMSSAPTTGSTYGNTGVNSNTNVRGNLLHWSRSRGAGHY